VALAPVAGANRIDPFKFSGDFNSLCAEHIFLLTFEGVFIERNESVKLFALA
jgi:hypothetical protein